MTWLFKPSLRVIRIDFRGYESENGNIIHLRKFFCCEVLADLHKERWAGIFRFTSLEHEMIYKTPLFDTALWFRPDSEMPILLING
jgi:hypothetical protein